MSVICGICVDSYKAEDVVVAAGKCGHIFHSPCLEDWCKKQPTCPVCREHISGPDLLRIYFNIDGTTPVAHETKQLIEELMRESSSKNDEIAALRTQAKDLMEQLKAAQKKKPTIVYRNVGNNEMAPPIEEHATTEMQMYNEIPNYPTNGHGYEIPVLSSWNYYNWVVSPQNDYMIQGSLLNPEYSNLNPDANHFYPKWSNAGNTEQSDV